MKAPRTRLEPNIYQYPDGRYEVLVSAAGRVAPATRFPATTPIEQIRTWRDDAIRRLMREARDIRVAAVRAGLPPGVTREPDGRLLARVKVGTERPVCRFPAGTDPAVAAAWIEQTRVELLAKRADYGEAPIVAHRPAREGETLEVDIARYLPQIAGRASTKADTSHLRAWLPVVVNGIRLGTLRRNAITTELVNLAIALWRTVPSAHTVRRVRVATHTRDGHTMPGYERKAPTTSGAVVADRTIRHRCRMLADLYHALDGKRAPTPVDDARIPTVPKDHPIAVDGGTVLTVAWNLAKAALGRPRQRAPHDPEAYAAREAVRRRDRQQTYARYVVLVTTGQRPVQVMRARPEDLDLTVGTWIVRSAKLEPAHTIVLTNDMRQAWQAFIDADAWGPYDTTVHANRVHAAGWPKGIRPYNARHTLMIDAVKLGIDLGDVQGLAGHTSPLTTRRFYAPHQIDRQRAVSQQLEGRMKDLFAPRLVKK